MPNQQPLVSVVTPVYNGELFIKECIDSVLEQSYSNWEYIILDNCSTDHTPAIIQEYAKADTRITIYRNDSLLPIMDNWNSALRKISLQSVYCKVIHADDRLFPDCLSLMVNIAEQKPAIGLVGAYAQWGDKIACDGLPENIRIFPGHEICRRTLLRQIYPFLSPSALMIRSSLVREREHFYPGPNLEADVDILFELLKDCDFGFVPQILSFIRRHEGSATAKLAQPMNTLLSQRLKLLKKHGPAFLGEKELELQITAYLQKYYQYLSTAVGKQRGGRFWDFHSRTMRELGYPLSRSRLLTFKLFSLVKRGIKQLEIALARR